MSARAEQLQQDDLLSRYVEASRRHATAARPRSGGDLMLARYLKALERYGPSDAAPRFEDFRTCANCGHHGRFELSAGGWAECSACGTLA
jgi:hypothetical protein